MKQESLLDFISQAFDRELFKEVKHLFHVRDVCINDALHGIAVAARFCPRINIGKNIIVIVNRDRGNLVAARSEELVEGFFVFRRRACAKLRMTEIAELFAALGKKTTDYGLAANDILLVVFNRSLVNTNM